MQMFEIERENGSRDRKICSIKGKETEKFDIEKGYAVFLGEISKNQTFCSRQRDIRDRG